MQKIVVHTFNMSDVDDPEIYAAQPIYEWQQTEIGKWITAHSKPEPYWTLGFSTSSHCHRVTIVAQLQDQDATYFQLKYGHKNS